MHHLSAISLKTRFLDYLLNPNPLTQNNSFCVGQELMYGSEKRMADMVLVIDHNLIAVEIKSQKDNLLRLPSQLASYQKVFDYTYIITTPHHLEGVKNNAMSECGIILYDNDTFTLIRRAVKSKMIEKREMLETMNLNYLRKTFSLKSNLSSGEVKDLLMKKGQSHIKKALFQFFQDRIHPRFLLFLQQKGEVCHSEDIFILSMHYSRISK